MTRSDVLGVWEAREGQNVLQIELSGDGTSTVSGLPAAVVATDRPAQLSWADTIDSTGDWSFWTPGADIDVSLSDTAREGIYSSVRLNPQGSELVLYYGDIDFPSHLTLTRVEAPSTPPPETLVPRDLVGSWASRSDGDLELRADGTFQLTDVPLRLLAVDDTEIVRDEDIDVSGRWTMIETPLPLSEVSGPTLSLSDTFGHDPNLFDSLGLTLHEMDGELSLTLSDGKAKWKLP
ncbi:hypothetical protein [Herbiconiux ginsengi]|uniref:Uncharacterized protein n=1 Tax=Herbiconiux ginsengi TaxID=381665 RepID=A0A1H3S5J6_9MICO|nr:hypothetical protein [Herbiconiux ginsengi]SDZ32855.1 hypothetical protein SAMN05216554_3302 [Herbiconiux ginsengi]